MRRVTKQCLSISALVLGIALGSGSAVAAPCAGGITFGVDFTGSYTCTSLGTPDGIDPALGGITFLDNDTLLIGGFGNGSAGYIAQIGVIRGVDNHITGFSGTSSLFSTAPYIDGGLAFGPDGVLFATGYPNNTLIQIKPGSTTPDKIIDLTALGGSGADLASLGTLTFVPTGFAGAGTFKLASYSTGNWVEGTLTPDGTGTFDITLGSVITNLTGGPEGIVYVDGANAGFTVDSVLISEWGLGQVGTYEIDSNGDPIFSTRRDFLTGLSGVEGAVIDPLTGDFLFSTFGGGDQVIVISGFKAPPISGPIPEPATWAMMIAGLGAVGAGLRRARRTGVSFA